MRPDDATTRYVWPVPTTDAATFCATLVDEWARAGVTDAFVAPGSRSTPMALALAAEERFTLHVFHDERAASFAALGHGLAAGAPAVALCTSGTAATHFHGAVVEADLSSVPMIVCTADRPPELWDIGAPQTIDQTHLFGSTVRFFAEPGVPDGATAGSWRSLASRAVAEAAGWSGRPGPVHLNLSFRDPLVGDPGPLPPGRSDSKPWHEVRRRTTKGQAGDPVEGSPTTVEPDAGVVPMLVRDGRSTRGVIIAGAGTAEPPAVVALAERLGWPLLADHRSAARSGPCAIRHFDALLRNERFAAAVEPDVIVRFGDALASKVLTQWLAATDAHVVAVNEDGRWSDPERIVSTVITGTGTGTGTAAELLRWLPDTVEPSPDLDRWRCADDAAATVIAAELGDRADDEIAIARAVVALVPTGGALVVASSMPVRDVEWYGPTRPDIDVFANRGANGIDGTIATAIGVASTGRSTTVLLGDVAFLHDSSALVGLAARTIDLQVVVIDNDGGGIFSFLPQAELLETPTYEQLFGTPHGTDLTALAAAHGLTVAPWPPPMDGGITITVVTSGRAQNAASHRRINDAVAAAIDG